MPNTQTTSNIKFKQRAAINSTCTIKIGLVIFILSPERKKDIYSITDDLYQISSVALSQASKVTQFSYSRISSQE